MPKRPLAALLLAFAGVLATSSPSSARGRVLTATGVIAPVAGSGMSYTFTLTNTGDQGMPATGNQPIACIHFLAAAGVQVASVDQPGGAQTTLVPGQGFDATLTPPLPERASLTWTFTTSSPYPPGAGGSLTISPDCANVVPASVSGPTGSATTTAPTTTTVVTTPAGRCQCIHLNVSMKPANVYTTAAELAPVGDPLARLAGLATWSLTCSGGSGRCSGTVALKAPLGVQVKLFTASSFVPVSGPEKGRALYRPGRPARLRLSCAGPCNATTTGSFFLVVDSASASAAGALAGKTLTLRLALSCSTGSSEMLRFVVTPLGRLDRSRSKLG